jgi:pimeloyl-ACP methyl ester carboxylesterase
VQRIERTVHATDGRALQILLAGPPAGDHIFYLYGTPGVLGAYEPQIEEGVRRDLRHVFHLRPGYGGSDRRPGRSIVDGAADVAAIADQLGIETFFVLGESGGGPYALACAARLPARVRAAALLAGVAPSTAEGLAWEEGMGEGNLRELEAAREGVEVLQPYLEEQAMALRSVSDEAQLRAALDGHLCDADRAAIDGDLATFLVGAWKQIGEDDVGGWVDDDLAFVKDWGFDLGEVAAPVTVWQGQDDLMVPFGHAAWLANRLPNAELHLLEGEGHISLPSHYGSILDSLLALET